MEKLSNESSNLYSISFVVITGCNENGNMMLVIKLVVVFIVNFAMDKTMFMEMNEYILSQERELESSYIFFVMITGFNDNANMM